MSVSCTFTVKTNKNLSDENDNDCGGIKPSMLEIWILNDIKKIRIIFKGMLGNKLTILKIDK